MLSLRDNGDFRSWNKCIIILLYGHTPRVVGGTGSRKWLIEWDDPDSLRHLNTWSLVASADWEGFGCMPSLEAVCPYRWALRFQNVSCYFQVSFFSLFCLRVKNVNFQFSASSSIYNGCLLQCFCTMMVMNSCPSGMVSPK